MTTPTSVAAKIGVPTDDAEIQPYPTTGQLVANLNPSYSDLLRDVGSERGNVYCYIVDSVEVSTDGWFEHHGSGPNFQGDRITLCTCKHLMRTFQDADQWEGTWVAGFTGINAVGDRRHYLVYLMRIGAAFESQRELWNWLPQETRKRKAAHLNRHGDIFEPWERLRDPFDPRHYTPPRTDHVHCSSNNWHGDVDYVGASGRRAALLVGDPAASYLWDEPTIASSFRLHRGQSKMNFQSFLSSLH